MKKVSLLLLPVAALLITGCQKSITGSDMPELTKNPGHPQKIVVSDYRDGDAALLTEYIDKINVEETFEQYPNFLKYYHKSKLKGEEGEYTTYHIYQDSTYYYLQDSGDFKYKVAVSDGSVEFGQLNPYIIGNIAMHVSQAQYIYRMMHDNGAPPGYVHYLYNDGKLTRSGDVYTLTTSEVNKYDNSIKDDFVRKLTIKNAYFTNYEVNHTRSEGKHKITRKTKVAFTYVAEATLYPAANMPNLADYITSNYNMGLYAFI